MTAEEDHQLMMNRLGINEIRPGADQWQKLRRSETVEDFGREVYGRVPANAPKVNWEKVEVSDTGRVGGVPVIVKKLVGHADNSAYPLIAVNIELSLTTPAGMAGPVPVMMEFGFGGFGFRPPPGAQSGPTWQEQVLANGWGYAILIPSTVQADNGAGLTGGIIGLCNKGQPRKPDDWGALRAWAWGASRSLDYLETDPTVDVKRVGIEGLSRYGKAALVAMAYDERFAIGFIGSSGEGGAKLHRRVFGELVENLAGSGEYHWTAGNFIRYAGPLTPKDLPVGAHELIALRAAGPVYRLLGKKDLGTNAFPPQESSLTDGDIAFRPVFITTFPQGLPPLRNTDLTRQRWRFFCARNRVQIIP